MFLINSAKKEHAQNRIIYAQGENRYEEYKVIGMNNGSKISLLLEDYPRNGYHIYSKIVGRSTSGSAFPACIPNTWARSTAWRCPKDTG